jgi:hypothetical protein
MRTETTFVPRLDALEAVVASLRAIKRPSLKLHRELKRTKHRLRVWRRKLGAKP